MKVTRLGLNALTIGSDIEDELVDTETGEVIKIEMTEEIPDGLSEEMNDDSGDHESEGGENNGAGNSGDSSFERT